MKKQKGFIKIVLIIIAIIAVALFVYIRMGYRTEVIPSNVTDNENSSSFQNSVKDITSDWKTYSKYGFEFQYPTEWITSKDDSIIKYHWILTDDLLYFEPNRISPKDSLAMTFSLMDNTANKYTIDNLVGCVNSESQIILECKDVIINGVSYKRVIGKSSASEVGGIPIVLDQKYIKIVTVFDNKSLVVSAKLNDRDMLDEKVILAKFDSILPTFKFTK